MDLGILIYDALGRVAVHARRAHVMRARLHRERPTSVEFKVAAPTRHPLSEEGRVGLQGPSTVAAGSPVDARDRKAQVIGARSLDASFDVVAESVERSEDRAKVRAAVERLTPVQRQAIDLAYFGGLTYREVAESLDRPLGTIKTRMRSALLALSDILGGNDQIGGRDG